MTEPEPLPDLEEVAALADDLLRDLTPAAGDAEEVRATLTEWCDDLDPRKFAADCMTSTVPLDQAPPGALALTPPGEPA
jgi:hypothetical protein